MNLQKVAAILALAGLTGCGIPPVDETLISDKPANARSFAIAEKAVWACTDQQNRKAVLTRFKKAGFGVIEKQVEIRGGRKIDRAFITAPDEAVSVLYHGRTCYVGLENMTPKQSAQLASIWAKAHGAKANSEYGDGLSDHVSAAWRRFVNEPARIPDKAAYEHRIYITAYKTWPHGPYDPQNNTPFNIDGIFPDKPGAAVRLTHAIECKGIKSTGPRSGVFLPCTKPDYRPN